MNGVSNCRSQVSIYGKNKIVERFQQHAAAYITQNQDVPQFQMIFLRRNIRRAEDLCE